jgi:hypothetical protein
VIDAVLTETTTKGTWSVVLQQLWQYRRPLKWTCGRSRGLTMDGAGFRLSRVIETTSPMWIVEAVAV